MSRSKKVFAGLAIVFFVLLLYASYDISRRTTFPGSKPQLKERIEEQFLKKDTIRKDSANAIQR
ncbi:MAG: hypothetical protein KIT62_17165 [Cyclobacteriaceae bacterium]|nr:hypothetical protein [Cyclobacteriaceae bacterium]